MLELLSSITAVGAGDASGIALKPDGTVYLWGRNDAGQQALGSTDTNAHSIPTQVSGISTASAIAADNKHMLVTLQDGTMQSWGLNNHGQLGIGAVNSTGCMCRFSVQTVSTIWHVVTAAGGDASSQAVTADGNTWSWGSDAHHGDPCRQHHDYNPDGTVLDEKDGKGNVILAYQYDALQRVASTQDGVEAGNTCTQLGRRERVVLLALHDYVGTVGTPARQVDAVLRLAADTITTKPDLVETKDAALHLCVVPATLRRDIVQRVTSAADSAAAEPGTTRSAMPTG